MQAYLIDPAAKTITAVEYSGDWQEIKTFIDCEYFTHVQIDENGDGIYLDDEGLMHGPTQFFKVRGYPNPLAGKGLVLGSDDEGESTSPKTSLADLNSLISFGDILSVGGKVMFLHDSGKVEPIAA